MDPQLAVILADIKAKLDALTQVMSQKQETDNKILIKLETAHEQPSTEEPLM